MWVGVSLRDDIGCGFKPFDGQLSPKKKPLLFLLLAGFCAFLVPILHLQAQAANPTYLSASPSSITMPGSITYCGGIPNITVDVQYWWNGAFYEADYGVTFGPDGCVSNYYDYAGWAGTYTFTGIRNSANGPYGAFSSIYTVVTLYTTPPPPTISYFYPSPNPINSGGGTYLYWGSSNATYAYLNGQYVGTSGYLYVSPSSTTQYTLTVYNSVWQAASASTMVTVNTPADSAYMYYQSVSTAMVPGQAYMATVMMQNSGSTTWAGYAGYRLCSQNPPNNTTWGMQCVSLASNEIVSPGSLKSFTFTVTAPATPGTYNFQWQMWRDGVGWFGSPSTSLLVGDVPPQPTSMVFSPTSMNAGNGTYTLTVGNGAGMNLDFQYSWSGNPGYVYTATNWGPLDAQGQRVVTVNHGDNQGTYQFLKVKNSLASQWVDLPISPPVTFTILGPEPYANTLTITPNPVQPPSSFTVTAANAGGISADAQYNFNGSGPQYSMPWLSFNTAADGSTGVATLSLKTCRPVGVYKYTGLRNNFGGDLRLTEGWVPQNTSHTTNCPGVPAINSVSTRSEGGGVYDVFFTGSNLCGITGIISAQGINFSNFLPAWDESGTTLSANADQGTPIDLSRLTLISPCTPATDKAAFVSQSAPSTMAPGQTASFSITFQNVGNTTWTSAGGYQLGGLNGNWGLSQVSLAAGDSIAPGQSKTFTFTITAPTIWSPLRWQLLRGANGFGDQSPDPGITIGVASDASFVSQSAPSSMVARQSYSVSLTFTNQGTQSWTAAGGYQLGSQNPPNNTTWGMAGVPLAAGDSIAAGQSKTFTFNVTAPAAAGTYNFQWQLSQGSNGWFGAKSTTVAVVVSTNPGFPSKEYIYLGGRLLATEEATTQAGKRADPAGPHITATHISFEGKHLKVSVRGDNFTANSVIWVEGRSQQTTILSPTHLSTVLSDTEAAGGGILHVRVANPAVEGGVSKEVSVNVPLR